MSERQQKRAGVGGIVLAHGILLVLVTSLMLGCRDESGTGQVVSPLPALPLQVDDGRFEVSASVIYDGCNSTKVFDGTYDITLGESGFSMGGWAGDWNATANTLKAHGESSHSQSTTRDCTMTTWTTVDITFMSENEFSGNVVYRYRAVGVCACCTSCQSTWRIIGVRVVQD